MLPYQKENFPMGAKIMSGSVEAFFRKVPVMINPADVPIITCGATKAIAASNFKALPVFMTLPNSLEEKAESLGDLQKELEELEQKKKKDEELLLELEKEIKEIESFCDEVEAPFDLLVKQKKEKQKFVEKSQETLQSLEKQIEENRISLEAVGRSFQEKDGELKRQIEKIGKVRGELAQAEARSGKLVSLFKTAVTVIFVAAGVLGAALMRVQSGSLFAGSLLLSLIAALTSLMAFDKISQIERTHAELSLSVQKKGKELDGIEKQKTELKKPQEKFDSLFKETEEASLAFKELDKQQNQIIEQVKLKDDRKEAIQIECISASERIKAFSVRLAEIPEEQKRWLESIKKGVSEKDLLEHRNYFQTLKQQLEPLLGELSHANLEITLFSSAERKGAKETGNAQSLLKEAKQKIIENAQFAKIEIKQIDVELADRVVGSYQQAIDDCSRALEFLDSVDPGSIPNTLQFYEKCEELLADWDKEIEKFKPICKELDKYFCKIKSYKEPMFEFIESLGIEDAKNFYDVLKSIQKDVSSSISRLKASKEIHGESETSDCSSSSVASSGSDDSVSSASEIESEEEEDSIRDEDPFETFASVIDGFQKIYSSSWRSCQTENREVQTYNAFHSRVCKSILSILSVGGEIFKKMEEEALVEIIDDLCKKWDSLSREEKGKEIFLKRR